MEMDRQTTQFGACGCENMLMEVGDDGPKEIIFEL